MRCFHPWFLILTPPLYSTWVCIFKQSHTWLWFSPSLPPHESEMRFDIVLLLFSFSQEYVFEELIGTKDRTSVKRGAVSSEEQGWAGTGSLGGFPDAGFLACLHFLSWQMPGISPPTITSFFLACPQPANVIWKNVKNCTRHVSSSDQSEYMYMKIPSEMWNDLNSFSLNKGRFHQLVLGRKGAKISLTDVQTVFVLLLFFSTRNGNEVRGPQDIWESS